MSPLAVNMSRDYIPTYLTSHHGEENLKREGRESRGVDHSLRVMDKVSDPEVFSPKPDSIFGIRVSFS